ncbi:Dihydroflavonol 4-reductase [Zea mays]|uniref:Flavanone 4-reductase n=2 Tax=Zea mays TaxID=4577 RepID=B4FS33_MAIZE|nr:anthocyaninless 4 [Zea mays]ACF84926.1 unknown [Zea mays]AQK96914.1 Dihydroflavonol-4-reductase [Zea mays]PWZ08585.1 Dihydroflavonol 4-reductase [Zea mays]|eukprot:NP_001140905.1 anthocyaninless 4 [Zea mays]
MRDVVAKREAMKGGASSKGPVVVTGASGFVGSWLVMKLLQAGYTVRATVRDPENVGKTKPLLDLPGATERLSIWKADLADEDSFDEAIRGCTGVFHVATPTDFESKDPENEVIKPTVEGMIRILRACKEAGTVRRIVFTSSAGTVCVEERQRPVYDHDNWSDVDFCRRVKMTGWMYFVSKSLAEKAAVAYAAEHGLDLVSVIPTLVVGPFLSAAMPPSLVTALALVTGNEAHYSILKQVQFVHLDDLCDAEIFLFEHPAAAGRYVCSSHDATIHGLAAMLRDRYPEYDIPQKLRGIEDELQLVHFSSKKLLDHGFTFRYTVEDMFDAGIRTCREKGLIPLATAGGVGSASLRTPGETARRM